MSLNPKVSNAGVNAAANALGALCNSGFVDIYDGTQPADADTGVTTQNLLVRLPMSATAFASAAAGVITANPITPTTIAISGTAAWCRVTKSDHSAVFDGTVGTSGANLIMGSVALSAGAQASISSLTFTESKG